MLDFLLGAIVVAFGVRGWWRGLLRGAIGLGVLVVGLVLAFRLSTPLGDVAESMAGVSPEVGRLVAGIAIFLAISFGAAVVSKILHKGLRVMPGLPTVNRAAGAFFAVVTTVAVATLALSLLTVTSVPDFVESQVERSVFAGYLTDPDEVPQKALGVVSGDRVLERLLNLREVAGTQRVVGDGDVVVLEATPSGEFEADTGEADELLILVNRERASEQVDPLVASDPLRRSRPSACGGCLRVGYFRRSVVGRTNARRPPSDRGYSGRCFRSGDGSRRDRRGGTRRPVRRLGSARRTDRSDLPPCRHSRGERPSRCNRRRGAGRLIRDLGVRIAPCRLSVGRHGTGSTVVPCHGARWPITHGRAC